MKISYADVHHELTRWLNGQRPHPVVFNTIWLFVGRVRALVWLLFRFLLWPWRYNLDYLLLKRSPYFDKDHYLRSNPDVNDAGHDPLDHYIRYGDAEGRCPMPFFDPKYYRRRAGLASFTLISILHYAWIGRYRRLPVSPWFDTMYYLEYNRDVEKRGLDPLLHYLRWGGLEGRSPCRAFDGSYYLRANPDVKASGMNPLVHYIQFGRHEGRPPRPNESDEECQTYFDNQQYHFLPTHVIPKDRWAKLIGSVQITDEAKKVAVIIPVYRNHALTWRCLVSILTAPNQIPFRIIVINDASPELELIADIEEMAWRGWLELLHNERNLGFVASANRGIRAAGNLDVVLLNADTEVYAGWLDRLHGAAWRHPRTASVTPLSNNATIASYPRFLHDTPYPLETDYATIDRLAAQVNVGVEVEVPTGVGFCMYMRRDAIEQIGLFDEKNFGRGYGEENDWCQRAIAYGWRNIITVDTFVWHFGGVSFQGEKDKRMVAAMKTMERKYPGYHKEVQRFIENDPLQTARQRLDWARMEHHMRTENVLLINHNRGGGSERHVQELTRRLIETDKGVYYLRPVRGKLGFVRLNHAVSRQLLHAPVYALNDTEAIVKALQRLRIGAIQLHGLVDLGAEAANHLTQLITATGVPLDIYIHDYTVICPRINLADGLGYYCGEPDNAQCNQCLTTHGSKIPGVADIATWRQQHERLLRMARAIDVPDHDVMQRLERYFPNITFRILPHEVIDRIEPISLRQRHASSPLHVIVIGAISLIKGYSILLACARLVKKRRLPIRFTVLGYTCDDAALEAADVTITGRYLEQEATERLRRLQPDVVWIPSTWPETYSYTLSIALRTGYPVYVFDIGAPAARLRRLGRENWVLPYGWCRDANQLLEHWMWIRDGGLHAHTHKEETLQSEYETWTPARVR